MVSRRKNLRPRRLGAPDVPATTPDAAIANPSVQTEDVEAPLAPLRGSGSSGFGPAIAGIMHGIDADIFRDPAAVQRMSRDSKAVARTADGTTVGIELPGEGVIDVPDDAPKDEGPEQEPA